jgi:hypothetical protein
VRTRHAMTVNRARCTVAYGRRLQVGDDLVAEQIEIDPGWVAPALVAAEYIPVEHTCGGEVVHRECKMKIGCHRLDRLMVCL